MICRDQNLPLIALPGQDVGGYDCAWLSALVGAAADELDLDSEPFADEVAEAVMFFLREVYPDNTVRLADVQEQLTACLDAIGQREVADCLEVSPPPQILALSEFAHRARGGLELSFFAPLATRLRILRESGVRRVRALGLNDCVRFLIREGCAAGRNEPELRREILEFLRDGLQPADEGHPVQITLG